MSMASCQLARGQQQLAPAAQAAWRASPAAAACRRHRRGELQVVHADAAAFQEVLVGGAVTAATAAAMLNGLSKGEPEVCITCSGTGAQAPCLVCNGEGKAAPVKAGSGPPGLISKSGRGSSRECRVCAGVGIIYCKQCSGSGYTKAL